MRIKGPEIVARCLYCGDLKVLNLEVDWFPGVPPSDLEQWRRAKEETKILVEDGEVIDGVCPKCDRMGMPLSILGGQ